MEHKLDFKKFTANSKSWDFSVGEHEFTCEEMDLGEEVTFFNYYIEPDGRQNVAKLRLVQATKCTKTPFTIEWIKYVFDTFYKDVTLDNNTEWNDLSLNNRLLFLCKLDSDFMSSVLKEISNYYEEKGKIVKK